MNKIIKIGKRKIGFNQPVFIVAEIGMNHNGNLDLAKKMIESAANCGVDAVKFQTFKTDLYYPPEVEDFAERKKHELLYEWHEELKTFSEQKGIEFFSTPFDNDSVDFLNELDVPCFKIASSDSNNYPLIRHIAQKQKPIILSTGYSALAQIEKAYNTIRDVGNEQIIMLHCVSSYPVQPYDLNLNVMNNLRTCFKVPVGFSDHSKDTPIAPIAATALGACIIEKHFTVDNDLPGYDHKMSTNPYDMKNIVSLIRDTELSLGDGIKKIVESEFVRLKKARRSLFWKSSYKEGRKITPDMVLPLRPGSGLEPEMLDKICEFRLKASVKAKTMVQMKDIDW